MSVEGEGFRQVLQNELVRRCKKNPKYSLRAFAKNLAIPASHLSMMLNAKRKITKKSIQQIGAKLGLPPHELDEFTSGAQPESNYRQLAIDHFQVIADWYHFAILELTSTRGFDENPRSIAKTLGVSINEVNAAVERLQRLGMLEVSANGKYKDVSGNITCLDNELLTAARRKHEKQILERALAALEDISENERDQSSMIMAIRSDRLPEAKKLITKFRRRLAQFLQDGYSRDSVYALGISLYPLSQFSNLKKGNKAS